MKPKSQCDKIRDALERARGSWVSMWQLHMERGSMAVHSRISDLRRQGMVIEQRRGKTLGSSFYMATQK